MPDALRAATIEDAAARLASIVDEMRARLAQHAALEPLLASLRLHPGADTSTYSHAMPP